MKITPLWALIALLRAPAVLAQATETSVEATTTTTAAALECTASQIATLCSYKLPGPNFAVASDGRAFCWEKCHTDTPCSFVIFVPGNPLTGSGTCWLYPGESFDPSTDTTGCDTPYLEIYDQPVCTGEGATPTAGACTATATPSAVAEVCGYPPPDEECWFDCSASGGATNCLSQCAERESCSYAVFNPHNPSNSPFATGTCWMYPNGTYDPGLATPCTGDPYQFVYDNVCPKPSPSSPPSSSSSSSSPPSSSSPTYSSSGSSSGSGSGSSSESSSGSSPGSSSAPSSALSPSANAVTSGTGTRGAPTASITFSANLAPRGLTIPNTLVVGMAVLLWQGF